MVLSYTVGSMSVLEMPGLEKIGTRDFFTRTLNLGASTNAIKMIVGGATLAKVDGHEYEFSTYAMPEIQLGVFGSGSNRVLVAVGGPPDISTFQFGDKPSGEKDGTWHHELSMTVPPHSDPLWLKVYLGRATSPEEVNELKPALRSASKPTDLAGRTKGGMPHWSTPVVNQGQIGTNDGPYTVDTFPEPVPNPWNAKTFFSGFDFFPDGRAAMCTFHGDVWIISGIDDSLEKITWRRYATGLFQPLGLKIVDGLVYVLGRDQITRLRDLNGDGEADFYENFNNDTIVTANYHEFCLDLQTDSKGNFYFCKGAPWPPNVDSPHQGTMMKVSKDGSKMEIFATGFRAPNGMTIGPHDEILTGDNQGHWMPSSKLNLVHRGGFYGMMPTAQSMITVKLGGTNLTINPSDPAVRAEFNIAPYLDSGKNKTTNEAPIPLQYDQPICWVPYGLDNSSGGQVYVTGDKWGPLEGLPLFQSYGKCTVFYVMTEVVDGVTQAGMVQLPLKFQSGLMRARFNAKDGQLYMCGLKGWQTSATRDGGFYRVRFTGKKFIGPKALHVRPNGVEITFTEPMDSFTVNDTGNWSLEQWNLIYSGNYGSPEVSTTDAGVKSHDSVTVKSIKLSADQKTVLLEIPGIKPVDQMTIKFNLKAADGSTVSQEIFNTIHQVPAHSMPPAGSGGDLHVWSGGIRAAADRSRSVTRSHSGEAIRN